MNDHFSTADTLFVSSLPAAKAAINPYPRHFKLGKDEDNLLIP
jgi:hypothetical protein